MKAMLCLAIMGALASCESTNALMPAMRAPGDLGLSVRFQAAVAENAAPSLFLIEIASGNVLASAESRFTPEVVQEVGAPTGHRLIVYASLTGDTIAAWEDATESSPDEQIVLFKRVHDPDGSSSWNAQNLFPPSRHAKPFPIYGKPATVDDDHLYFTIENGPGEKMKWTDLKAVPPGYKPPPPPEVRPDDAKTEKSEAETKDAGKTDAEKVDTAKADEVKVQSPNPYPSRIMRRRYAP
jgi:hypothetical protein